MPTCHDGWDMYGIPCDGIQNHAPCMATILSGTSDKVIGHGQAAIMASLYYRLSYAKPRWNPKVIYSNSKESVL